jgi:hypothetical protein
MNLAGSTCAPQEVHTPHKKVQLLASETDWEVTVYGWLANVFLRFIGALFIIKNDGREFLVRLLEVNSTRVQSDIVNRIQKSHGYIWRLRSESLCAKSAAWQSRPSAMGGRREKGSCTRVGSSEIADF